MMTEKNASAVDSAIETAAAVAAGLCGLAAMVSENPDLAGMVRYGVNPILVSVGHGDADPREQAIRFARAGLASGAVVTERTRGKYAGVDIEFGPVRLDVYAETERIQPSTPEHTLPPILSEVTHAESAMAASCRSLNRPGPVMTPASNPHRAGVPNHHHASGSAEIPDICTRPSGVAADPALLGLRSWVRRAVAERINRGALDVTDLWSMPEAVTDLVTDLVAQQTFVLRHRLNGAEAELSAAAIELDATTSLLCGRLEATVAELDAANDAVTDLVGELEDGAVR